MLVNPGTARLLNFKYKAKIINKNEVTIERNPKNIHKKTVEQIKKYEELAKARNVSWS